MIGPALIFMLLSVSVAKRTPSQLFITRTGPCDVVSGLDVVVSEMIIRRERYNFSISGYVNVSRNIANGWKVRASLQKCMDIRNRDSCEHSKAYTLIEGGCNVGSDMESLHQLARYMEPRLECPISAGSYRLLDYPFSTRDDYTVSKISTSEFGYKFRLEGCSDKVKVLCIETLVKLVYPRNENSSLSN